MEYVKRILVVDDEPDNLLLFSRYLKSEGYHVLTATDGVDALEAMAAERPDLVLLDVLMPNLDGISVCRRLKADPATVVIPVVLVTTLDSKDDRVRGLDAGADEFLSKPVYKEELMARVRSLLRWREARDALEATRMAELTDTFNRYVSPKIVETILAHPETADSALKDRNTRVEAVVLFADLRGFTQMSEALPPENVVKLLNDFFTLLTEIAHSFDGTIFNMAGDSLLMGFNVPLPQHDAANRALRAAVTMQKEFEKHAVEWHKRFGVRVGLGIGINRGEVIVGNVGSPTYMNYTVIGDAVNVASRLKDRAASGETLVSQAMTHAVDIVPSEITFEGLQPVRLKGKSDLQSVYQLKEQRT